LDRSGTRCGRRRRFPGALFAAAATALLSLSGTGFDPDWRRIDPLAQPEDHPALAAVRRRAGALEEAAGGSAGVFIHLGAEDPALAARIRGLAGEARLVHRRLYVARIPRDASRYLSRWPQVAYVEAARPARRLLDLSGPAVNAGAAQGPDPSRPPPYDKVKLSGAGVLVGVVDTGVSAVHPDFGGGAPGSGSRIVHGYTYSDAADPLTDPDGHGTHVAGIAAGNGFSSSGRYTGMAPGASLLAARTNFFTDDIVRAAADLVQYAGGAKSPAPVAINLSLGTMLGPHDGTSGFEAAVAALAEDNTLGSPRLIVTAAGNERGAREHFRAAAGPFGTATARLALKGPAEAQFWADGADAYRVAVTLYSGTGDPVDAVGAVPGAQAGSPARRLFLSNGAQSPPNGATLVLVTLDGGPGWTARIVMERTRNGGSGVVDGYVERTAAVFEDGTTDEGTLTEPACARHVVAVASFDTKSWTGAPVPRALSSFSSAGPTRDGRSRPDVAAPGAWIDSARSAESGLAPLPNPADNYTRLEGTSMAAPHVTGIAALVWESNPGLTGKAMRERLRRTAAAPFDGSSAPNSRWGQGPIDALAAVLDPVASISAPAAAAPGTRVTADARNSSGAFGQGVTCTWSLEAPPGSGAQLDRTTGTDTAFTPDIPGIYRLSVTVAQQQPPNTASATWAVRANTPPRAVISGPVSGPADSAAVFDGGASTDPDGRPIVRRWVLVSRPPGSATAALEQQEPARATLHPDLAGTYVVGLQVDDGLDNSVLATWSYRAEPLPGAPVITSTPPESATSGTAYTYRVAATGTPEPSFSLDTGPPGMTIDRTTGVVSWTPSAQDIGVHFVAVRARNGVVPDAVQTFSVTVSAAQAGSGGGGSGGGCSLAGKDAVAASSAPSLLPAAACILVLATRRRAAGPRTNEGGRGHTACLAHGKPRGGPRHDQR